MYDVVMVVLLEEHPVLQEIKKFGLGVHGSKNGLLMVEHIIFFLVRVVITVFLQFILMVIIFILILIRQEQIPMVQ